MVCLFLKLFTYQSDINFEEFHAKFIPKDCLPKELGGDLPTIAEMHATFRKELEDLSDHFIAEEQQRDEANGLTKTTSAPTSMIHSFGQLEID